MRKGSSFFLRHEIDDEVREHIRAKPVGNGFLFNRSIDIKIGLIKTGALYSFPVIHLPEAIFIEPEGVDCIISCQPG